MIKNLNVNKDSKLIAIFGDRGSGKSVLLTWFILKSTLPFYANFHVFDDELTELPYDKRKLCSRYNELHPEEIKNMDTNKKIIAITEAYEYFESRLGMGSFQRYMSYMVFQSRKRKAHFIIDTQLDDTIDHRFTRLCNYIIIAELAEDGSGFNYYCSNKKGTIATFSIPFRNAEKFWNRYDSWELVTTAQIEDLGTQIQTTNKPRLKEKLNELTERFFKEYGHMEQKRITHSVVESFLLDCEESDVYESYLYNKLHKPESNIYK